MPARGRAGGQGSGNRPESLGGHRRAGGSQVCVACLLLEEPLMVGPMCGLLLLCPSLPKRRHRRRFCLSRACATPSKRRASPPPFLSLERVRATVKTTSVAAHRPPPRSLLRTTVEQTKVVAARRGGRRRTRRARRRAQSVARRRGCTRVASDQEVRAPAQNTRQRPAVASAALVLLWRHRDPALWPRAAAAALPASDRRRRPRLSAVLFRNSREQVGRAFQKPNHNDMCTRLYPCSESVGCWAQRCSAHALLRPDKRHASWLASSQRHTPLKAVRWPSAHYIPEAQQQCSKWPSAPLPSNR